MYVQGQTGDICTFRAKQATTVELVGSYKHAWSRITICRWGIHESVCINKLPSPANPILPASQFLSKRHNMTARTRPEKRETAALNQPRPL